MFFLGLPVPLNSFPGLPWWLRGKEATCQFRRYGFYLWVRKTPWRRKRQPAPVFLPGKSHRQRSLEGSSPWGCKESDTTEVTEHACSIFSSLVLLRGCVDSWRNSHVSCTDLFSFWCASVTGGTEEQAGSLGPWQLAPLESEEKYAPRMEVLGVFCSVWGLIVLPWWLTARWVKDVIGNGFPGGPVVKNLLANAGDTRGVG